MNLDGITLHCITNELADILKGGQISKIYQLDARSLYFRIFNDTGIHHLVITLDDSPRLYVADTGHHRILECTHSGRVLRQFGVGSADLINGPAGEAAFNRPHGMIGGMMNKPPELAAQAINGMMQTLSLAKVGEFDDELKKLGLTTKGFAQAVENS